MVTKRDKVFIFDTSLRDGEQSPGASMTISQKIQFATQLQSLNVDIIEAGFPISSSAQFQAVEEISKRIVSSKVAALCRAVKGDVESAIKALKKAKHPRIHTFIATSDIHLKYKLGKTRSEALKMAVDAVKQAKKFTSDVEFSAEDAARSDLNFLKEITEAVIEAGATTVNLPDTVGYTVPQEYAEMISYVKNCQGGEQVVFSVHCHDDLGLAVANSLEAVLAGARQVECAVNGIGERAGNASLEEIVMAIHTRRDFYKLKTDINTKEIYKTSKLLTNITGMMVQPNKAIVGKNAFSHEAGIHQHGMLKNKKTYEIIRPESIGRKDSSLVLGRHSGKHGLSAFIKKMGIFLPPQELDKVYNRFTEIADKKKQIFEEDIIAILNETLEMEKDFFKLISAMTTSSSESGGMASVKLKLDKFVLTEVADGDGPVDAIYSAINKIVFNHPHVKQHIKLKLNEKSFSLLNYEINSITEGNDAMGGVKVLLKDKKDKEYPGHGYSTDIIIASAKAYISAINSYIRINTSK